MIRSGSLLAICHLLLVALMVERWSPVSGQAPCSLENVTLQENFNLTQFVGTWYEITWIAPEYQNAGNAWSNYYHVYNMDRFGSVTGYYSGKDPHSGECFFGGHGLLRTAVHPAMLRLYVVGQNADYDYWVMKTDYSSYAMVYSCQTRNSSTCLKAKSWLWGRSKALPDTLKQEARDLWGRLCMNLTLLLATDFTASDCLTQDPTIAGCHSNGFPVLTASTANLWIAFFIFCQTLWTSCL